MLLLISAKTNSIETQQFSFSFLRQCCPTSKAVDILFFMFSSLIEWTNQMYYNVFLDICLFIYKLMLNCYHYSMDTAELGACRSRALIIWDTTVNLMNERKRANESNVYLM